VLNQTFTDFELIIGDDASTDGSWDIIQSYTDPRIRAYRHEQRLGGGIINELVAEGNLSGLIAIQHSDDIWEPQKLEKQVAFLDEHPDVGAVFSHVSIIDEQGAPFEDTSHYYYHIFNQPNRSRHEWLNFFFYNGNALCHPSVLIRRQCYTELGVLRYGMAQIGDLDMWVRICLKYEIHVLPERLLRFRVRVAEANSSGYRPDARIRGQFEFYEMYAHYSEIRTSAEFLKVFPTAERYFTEKGYDLGFALGMIAFESEAFLATKLFGLELLFQAINDPDRAKSVRRIYGFGHSEFAALASKYDVFAIELKTALEDRQRQIAVLEPTIVVLQDDLNGVSATLAEIYASRWWRLLAPLRWIGRQRKRALRLAKALPGLLFRPGGPLPLYKDFLNTWRQDGWAMAKAFAYEYTERVVETKPSSDSVPTSPADAERALRSSQRPAILFVCHEASRTGAPVFLLQLIRFLSTRLDLDFVILLRRGGDLEPEFRKFGQTIVMSNPDRLDPLILHALRKRTIKLVYSNTITNGFVQRQLKRLGCPILCHVHELAYSIGNFYEDNLKHILDTTTKFLAGSGAVASNLQEQLHLPAERIIVAYPFLSDERPTDGQQLDRPLPLPTEAIVVGACGLIGWRKGPDLFLQAARRVLADTTQPVVFVWVGGPLSRGDHLHLHYEAEMMGIEKQVIFTGNVPSHLPYFAQFDIFVLPSREDPFPLVALDAAALGMPIVCFEKAGGTPELVERDAGIVVPYLDTECMADAIRKLIEDKALRQQLGERARQKVVQRYDIAGGGEHIARIIETFL
jgi:glycosyltransferase involved in cell wall biosynthesis